jgi:FtsH-binding integral membrane protein
MEATFEDLALGLAQAAALALAVATFLFVAAAIRAKQWLWLLSFPLVLPAFVFAYRQRRNLKTPGLLLLASITLSLAAALVAGDLIEDKHPSEFSSRNFAQRALGCSGTALWGKLL